jgi:manganese transport protein
MLQKIKKSFKNIGPGALIAAAFIGPGTVTICTISGSKFGYTLLWAILFSIVTAMILQEMAVRLAIVTQKSISELIRDELFNPTLRNFILTLTFSAIIIGNIAYEAGNIGGGVLGLETLVGEIKFKFKSFTFNTLSLVIGIISFIILFIGNNKLLEKVLIFFVFIMSLSFIITALITKPNLQDVLNGIFTVKSPDESLLTILALIGTTVVPYNLFLHASLVRAKWKKKTDLYIARKDMYINIGIGGLISIAIIITAANVSLKNISSTVDLAKGLEPLFGNQSKYFLGIGLLCAGITSSVTAPLAAAYVACGCFGWVPHLKSFKFRLIWITVLLFGISFSSTGIKLITIIQFAQVANALLLPIISIVLFYIMNNHRIFGIYKNSHLQNLFGSLVILVTVFLSIRTIVTLLN